MTLSEAKKLGEVFARLSLRKDNRIWVEAVGKHCECRDTMSSECTIEIKEISLSNAL